VLEYETVAKAKDEQLSLLSVELHTGRSHQIRVQLSASGFPLYGDQKYGRKVNRRGQQIALWAHTLEVEHPTKKRSFAFNHCHRTNIRGIFGTNESYPNFIRIAPKDELRSFLMKKISSFH